MQHDQHRFFETFAIVLPQKDEGRILVGLWKKKVKKFLKFVGISRTRKSSLCVRLLRLVTIFKHVDQEHVKVGSNRTNLIACMLKERKTITLTELDRSDFYNTLSASRKDTTGTNFTVLESLKCTTREIVENETSRQEVEAALERNPNSFRPKITSSPRGVVDIKVAAAMEEIGGTSVSDGVELVIDVAAVGDAVLVCGSGGNRMQAACCSVEDDVAVARDVCVQEDLLVPWSCIQFPQWQWISRVEGLFCCFGC
ncbi:hypothetical protein C5167_002209 [Papaver somniferum]|uniref:Uncharacterized protein n=1 Tax=Papaver somniferum TaxID=3469 RepID=A0A4Y7L194_PAPSO|nr:hypothetical protein C5167_002209 [Papaver somniferum]